jgi:hypothetical protein
VCRPTVKQARETPLTKCRAKYRTGRRWEGGGIQSEAMPSAPFDLENQALLPTSHDPQVVRHEHTPEQERQATNDRFCDAHLPVE